MPKIPGKFVIPPDLVWDENNPPVRNGCNGLVEIHAPGCDGGCDKTPLTKSETLLVNEARAWGRAGLDEGRYRVDIFSMQIMLDSLIEYLGVDREELDEVFRMAKFEKMKRIRIANEKAVKDRQRQILVQDKRIIGPSGEILN